MSAKQLACRLPCLGLTLTVFMTIVASTRGGPDYTFESYYSNPAYKNVTPVVLLTVEPALIEFFNPFGNVIVALNRIDPFTVPDPVVSASDGLDLTCGQGCEVKSVVYERSRGVFTRNGEPLGTFVGDAPLKAFTFTCNVTGGTGTYLNISMQRLYGLYSDLDLRDGQRRVTELQEQDGMGAEVKLPVDVQSDGSTQGHPASPHGRKMGGAAAAIGSSSKGAPDAGLPSGPIVLDTDTRQQEQEAQISDAMERNTSHATRPPPRRRELQSVGPKSLVTSDYTYRFTIRFSFAGAPRDYTTQVVIVPRILRDETPRRRVYCEATDEIASTLPKRVPCSSATSRPAPYVIEADTFDKLHPEEAEWLDGRLVKTSAAIQDFVVSRLGPEFGLSKDKYQLKVAVANSGGGKRATVYGFGVAKALYDLGVMDHASWVAGLSGGSWFLSSWYAAMLNSTSIKDPEEVFDKIKDRFWRDVIPGQFDANEILTNYLRKSDPPSFTVFPDNGVDTELIMCEANVKLNHPWMMSGRGGTWNEYWSRAVASQIFTDGSRGAGLTFSEFASSPLLSQHAAPLPLIAVQENRGDGNQADHYHLWEITPFDISTTRDEETLFLSFPTSLIGSRPFNREGYETTCTTNYDQLSFLYGLSSGATSIGTETPPFITQIFCGSGPTQICQPVSVPSPFWNGEWYDLVNWTRLGFPPYNTTNKSYLSKYAYEYTEAAAFRLSPQEAATEEYLGQRNLFLTDGGFNKNTPIWPFISSTRTADVIFAVDGSAALTRVSLTKSTLSNDTLMPSDVDQDYECPLDGATLCPTVLFTGFSQGNYYDGTNNCCDICNGPLSFSGICYPDPNPDINDLFNMGSYSEYNSLPPLPTIEDKDLLRKVTIFGCDNVANTSAIVYIPNRIIRSGLGGFPTFAGLLNLYVPLFVNVRLTPEILINAFGNAQASLPNQRGLPDFDTCLACLYYAKALQCNNFMSKGGVDACEGCYEAYCWQPGLNVS